jgi:hypothetical protein
MATDELAQGNDVYISAGRLAAFTRLAERHILRVPKDKDDDDDDNDNNNNNANNDNKNLIW